jgi:hypothetical protein
VTGAYYDLFEAFAHEQPQLMLDEWRASDLNHRFRDTRRERSKACREPARQNRNRRHVFIGG